MRLFGQGFLVGIAIRFAIAVVLRTDVSWVGMLRSGAILGILHVVLVLGRIYGIW